MNNRERLRTLNKQATLLYNAIDHLTAHPPDEPNQLELPIRLTDTIRYELAALQFSIITEDSNQ